MKYTLPPLPYAYDALEPVLSEETLRVHHDKHHQAYTDKLNKIAEEMDINYDQKNLSILIGTIDEDTAPALRNNLGGFVNHNLYWENLAPGGKEISDRFRKVILTEAGSMDNLKQSLVDLGMSQFGSGWAWLVIRPNGELMGITTSNQDHPMMPKVIPEQGDTYRPILTIDVWEHAYYLNYKSSRKEYLEKIFDLINWEVVEKRYFDHLKIMGIECPYPIND